MVQLRQQHSNWHCNEWILHSVHLHDAIATTSLNLIHFISFDRKFMVAIAPCEQPFTCQTNKDFVSLNEHKIHVVLRQVLVFFSSKMMAVKPAGSY